MPGKPRYTEEHVRDAVANSRSLTEALRRLSLRPAGGNHHTLRKLIERYEVSTEHFNPNWRLRAQRRQTALPLAEVLVERSTYKRSSLKRRLYETGLKERACELCAQTETWHGRSMSLILDHINGVPDDNRLENLRIVCPNCAATLETHCGRKNRVDVEPRTCLFCGSSFRPKYESHRYCSQACGVHSKGPTKPKPEIRKVARPSYENLIDDLRTMSMVAVGRKYGVSDNAVRKWIRWYEAAQGREEAA